MRKAIDYLCLTAAKVHFLGGVILKMRGEIGERTADGLAKVVLEIRDDVDRVLNRLKILHLRKGPP